MNVWKRRTVKSLQLKHSQLETGQYSRSEDHNFRIHLLREHGGKGSLFVYGLGGLELAAGDQNTTAYTNAPFYARAGEGAGCVTSPSVQGQVDERPACC